ncbi:hypothetical protein [Roseateles sp.]|uniref:hypothetical protein n=1 Tax=Roseateles sp. TaxID=1971397 RepID=UPI0025E6E575|nr:hypothetical protein [Roseateles sp.]MBV8034401.1 hypothetical protein [Roseateles sp.]
MNRIVESIASLAQHLITLATDPEQYRPAACPHCGFARVWRHGCYHRKADRSRGGAHDPGGGAALPVRGLPADLLVAAGVLGTAALV